MEASVNSSHNDSLLIKMKSLIVEINNYLTSRTEDSALLINKHLQTFSLTIDINVFDPDTNIGVKFFVSLYDLFTKIEPQSQMSWYCVDVLINASRNTSARRALINTYNFIPSLSRLLCDHLTGVKKKKLLNLMQDLSCGIKISWQIPHLPHLLKTLSKWVENQDEEIVCLSLGVLVNLCYKNLPAVYSLSKSIDIKKFLRFCLPLKGPIIEIHVCKLMVILDHMHMDIPKDTLIRFVKPTFLSIFEAFKNNDAIVLRQIVDFFADAVSQNNGRHILQNYEHYPEQIESLLGLVDGSSRNSSTDSGYFPKENKPECISLILEFIHCIMSYNIEVIANFHPRITKLCLDWVNSEWVSFQALTVLTKIVENKRESENGKGTNQVTQLLITALPAFVLILQSNTIPSNMESSRRLGALFQLFRALLQVNGIRTCLLQTLKDDLIGGVFTTLQSDDLNVECLPILKSNDSGFTSTDAAYTYLYALALVNDLTQYSVGWLGLQSTLMENRKIHMIIAQALYGGTTEIKGLALEISKHPNLPIKKVALAMRTLQTMFLNSNESNSRTDGSSDIGYPMLSFVQMDRLDDTLARLQKIMDENNTASISTSQVMELYEYKMATLGYAEKSALNSIEAATERCTQLQHRLAQITAEQNKMQTLLFHKEHCLEQIAKSREEFRQMYEQEQNRAMASSGKVKVYEGQIKAKEKALAECEAQLNEGNKLIKEMSEEIVKLKDQLEKREQVINKLGELGNRSEKTLQKREELLKIANADIKNLNSQIINLEDKLNKKEIKLAELTEQYQQSRHIIDTITKVATSSQVP